MARDCYDVLKAIKGLNDLIKQPNYPSTWLFSAFDTDVYNGDSYIRRTTGPGKPDKIVLVLHAWNLTHTAMTMTPFIEMFTPGGLAFIPNALFLSPNFYGANNTPNACGSPQSTNIIKLLLEKVMAETGIKRVYMLAFSGGGHAGLMFMARCPGMIHRASVWNPVYHIADWIQQTGSSQVLSDMTAVTGHAPVNRDDPDYLARSPAGVLDCLEGPTDIIINCSTNDLTVPHAQHVAAYNHIVGKPGIRAAMCTTATGHTLNIYEAQQQLLRETSYT